MGTIINNKPSINVDQLQLMPDSGSSQVLFPTNIPNFPAVDVFRHSIYVAQSDDFTFLWNGPFLPGTSVGGDSILGCICYNLGVNQTTIKLADLNFLSMNGTLGLSNNLNVPTSITPIPFNILPNGIDVTLTWGNKQEWLSFVFRKKYIFSFVRPTGADTVNSITISTQFERYGGDGQTNSLDNTPVAPPTLILLSDIESGPELLGGMLDENCLQLTIYDPSTNTYEYIEPLSVPIDITDVLNNTKQFRLVVKAFPNRNTFNNQYIKTGIPFDSTYYPVNPDVGNRYTSTNNFKAIIKTF